MAPDALYVPVGIAQLCLHRRPGRAVWVQGQLRRNADSTERARVFDLCVMDETGDAFLTITGLRALPLESGAAAASDELHGCIHTIEWQPSAPLPAPSNTVPAPGAAAAHAQPGTWLLFADQGATATTLRAHLGRRGESSIVVIAGAQYQRRESALFSIDPANPQHYVRLLREAFAEDAICRGVVHLLSLDAAPAATTTEHTLAEDLSRGSVSAVLLVQAIAQQGWRQVPRLWLITRGAQQVQGQAHHELAIGQAPLWGLGRTLALEHPELECTRIDLDPDAASDSHAADYLLRELAANDREDQVALRGPTRYVARLHAGGLPESPALPTRLSAAAGRPFRLEISPPGTLDHLALWEAPRQPLGPEEVEIEVTAAGLNFLDVLLALAALPDDAAGADAQSPRLGGECAGRIVALGSAVTTLQIGQPVMALASRAFGSFVTTPQALVAPIPAGLTDAQAATLPIAFLTASYALSQVGRLSRGERVLIHAGAGGVGLAAIQWAQYLGAEVLATAGSEEKRQFLRNLGVAQVMDSRSPRFAAEVMQFTGGAGVDVVLNSLSGDFIDASFSLLRDHGRFVEIGKRDYYENRPLGLRPFLRNLSYSLVDLRAIIEQRPAEIQRLLEQLAPLFAAGALQPLPVQSFPIEQAAAAFHHMAQARHIGKVVLTIPPLASVPELPIRTHHVPPTIHGDASYLITGGLGGLGLRVAQWLVSQGARQVALVGRSAASAEALKTIASLEAAGARILVAQADVSSSTEVAALLVTLRQKLAPLRGIVHAAAVLDDHTVLELSAEHFRTVARGKLQGAWNLHALTLGVPLDFFILFSSLASVVGTPGQGNYAAANAFLDALAQYRHGLGLPALSLQWGAFSEVGLAAAADHRGQRLAYRGVASFTPARRTARADPAPRKPRCPGRRGALQHPPVDRVLPARSGHSLLPYSVHRKSVCRRAAADPGLGFHRPAHRRGAPRTPTADGRTPARPARQGAAAGCRAHRSLGLVH